MPFFHDQDRGGLRRLYVEAWRKHRAGRPLEPLEQAVAVELSVRGNAWDAAKQTPRVARQGLGVLTGLRPSGEAL